MTEGISKERLIEIKQSLPYGQARLNLDRLIKAECKELDHWLPIELSIVDNKEYLFITKNKRQRVDRFNPTQYATVNTDLRWQERPGDRYTHYKLLK